MTSQRTKARPDLDSVWLLITGVVGFLLGYLIIVFGAHHDPTSSRFASSPGFRSRGAGDNLKLEVVPGRLMEFSTQVGT
jgi:hypothetical protein